MKAFNDLAALAPSEIEALLALAGRLDQKPEPRALEGRVLALLFLSPSLRTLTSFQAAMLRLGGGSFVVSPEQAIHRLETRRGVVMDQEAAEHIREALPVIASYGDAIGIRAFAPRESLQADLRDADFQSMVELCPVPYINMESAIHHPAQSLADWKTLEDFAVPRSSRFVLTWAYHPKALPLAVPASTLTMAAMRGMEVVVLRPEGFALPEAVITKASSLATAFGGSVRETSDRDEALEGARVVYAKSWTSTRCYGDAEGDAALRRDLKDWCVSESWFERASEDCRFMHCLPVRREVVVTEEVLEGPRSVVLAEARNRMLVQMAVLHRMLAATGQ